MATSKSPGLLDAVMGVPRISAHGWRRLGWVTRYLITARGAVLALTLFACLFGGLLALPWPPAEGWRLILSTVTLLCAHAASNLLNDQVDWALGARRNGYLRLRYGAHPLAEGLMHPLTHAALLILTMTVTMLLGFFLGDLAGTPTYWLAGAGLLLAVCYTWLKRFGLGELAVFFVWGPMMVGGVYWVVSGDWGAEILVLSTVFGMGAMVVALGKHADERRDDAARAIRTLPVVLGAVWGPRLIAAVAVAQVLGTVGWAWFGSSWTYLLIVVALPALSSLLRVCLRRRPTARPRNYPSELWPLWYTAAAFRFARAAGAALVLAALFDGL